MRKSRVLVLNSRDYHKKKQSTFLVILLVIFIAIAAFLLLRQQQQVNIQNIRLFFYDSVNQELIPIERNVDISGTQEKAIKTIIEQLSLPPENLQSLIPAYTHVQSVSFQRDTCIVTFQDLSVTELIDSVVKESAAVYSLVNSITEFPGIHKVQLNIEGKQDLYFHRYVSIEHPLTRMTGQLLRGVNALLFFYHYPSESIMGELREIPQHDSLDKTAYNVVNQLIIGSPQHDMDSLIPQGTRINQAWVENAICHIDFSKEVRRFSLGASKELALVNLLVLSLTEMQGIERVQFLVEGQTVFTLGGHMAVDKPLQRWYGKSDENARIYFLRKFQHHLSFVPIEREVASMQPEDVIQALIDGTTATEKEQGISSDIPSGIKINACYPNENNELIVDLEVELSKFLNAQQEQNFLRQMVLSITENTRLQHIRFFFDGKKLESLPFGTDTSKVFTRALSF